MKVQSAVVVVAVACGVSFGACAPSDAPPGPSGMSGAPSGGSPGSTAGAGGSSNSSSGASGAGMAAGGACTSVTACGGSVVGTWTASSSCLKLSGMLDLGKAGLDPRSCTSATVNGSLSVSGTFTANANGTYKDDTTTTGNVQIEMVPGCLLISGTTINCEQGAVSALEGGGFKNAVCTSAAGGACSCTATFTQKGGMGTGTATPATSGNFTVANNVVSLTNDAGMSPYSFCTAAGTLTVTPQTTTPVTMGSITLTPVGGGGMGGAGGGGGGAPPTGGSGGGAVAGAGGSGGGGTGMRSDGPCDVYGAATMPCVAAYSMVRGLSKAYTGPLYQVRVGSSAMNTGMGGTLKDVAMGADGFADTAAVDTMCPSGTICTIVKLYDQSGNGNDLPTAKKGLSNGGTYSAMDDFESTLTKGPVMAGGHKVYPLYMAAREGYRLQAVGKNMPKGSAAEGIYELADGTHVGTACCWDFGNVTTDPTKYGTMNTLFFGKAFWGNGAGSGPWMMADFEAGVWAGGSKVGDPGWGSLNDAHPSNPNSPSLAVPFAMGILKTQSSKYALRAADLSTAMDLTTAFEGPMPKAMDNLGGIVLGVGGDNSNNSWGTFYEGAIVSGYPTPATDLAIMKNVKQVGYSAMK